jgi:hypothetical protein
MNSIEGTGSAQPTRHPYDTKRPHAPEAPKQAKKPPADSIDLSKAGRELAREDSAGKPAARQALIEAARRRLDSGKLDNLQALRRAAKKLMESGDLHRTPDED